MREDGDGRQQQKNQQEQTKDRSGVQSNNGRS